ncbi:MAG: tRNA preQ1(34) S-adenosylmethionine ribosyltransferase-isomerase QueA [Rhodospirillaceae bacterium]|nr:tRNA preQ1(34) S-adenosylmethionine ribosyltransferase-isomerase QueA [Rhodospirillaceae bacterium]
MNLADFDFRLPPERIALRPAVPRDSARLLEVGAGLRDLNVRDLPGLLAPGDLVVFNDTRVIPARLKGVRGNAAVEVTLHRRETAEVWRALAKPARKLKVGSKIGFAGGLSAEVVARGEEGEASLRFDRGGAALDQALETHGVIPLPPYITRPFGPDERDRADYQTMFAARSGAVAAPTAGLHFTPTVLNALRERGVGLAEVTLHVGLGTFQPVRTENIAAHRMHPEWGEIGPATVAAIDAARRRGGRIVAVGTTAARLLETAADESGTVGTFAGDTTLFITPGYRFKAVDLLLTNFHLPKSTLFMLVAAFAGLDRMRAAYAHAIEAGYRFYSYGDCCLLHNPDRA